METSRKSVFAHHAALRGALALIACLSAGCASWPRPRSEDPLPPQERLNLGVTYERKGELALALREYQRAEHGSLRGKALTYQGNVLSSLDRIPEARDRYRDALKVDPDNVEALNNLAWLLARDRHTLDEAERLALHALALNPIPRAPHENTLRVIRENRLMYGLPAPAETK